MRASVSCLDTARLSCPLKTLPHAPPELLDWRTSVTSNFGEPALIWPPSGFCLTVRLWRTEEEQPLIMCLGQGFGGLQERLSKTPGGGSADEGDTSGRRQHPLHHTTTAQPDCNNFLTNTSAGALQNHLRSCSY